MNRRSRIAIALTLLAAVHLAAALAGFLAPYGYDVQHRDFPYAPPSGLHLDGLRPYVCGLAPELPGMSYREDCARSFPVRLLPGGGRLFGADEPGVLFLLGTDASGRDVFSRLLYGARISLFAGLAAAAISLSLALALGSVAGFYGGWTDRIVTRGGELLMALPWLYLLLGARAFLPLHITPAQAFLLVVAIIGLLGWVRPAMLIRGVAMGARERGFVEAARGFGAGGAYLLRRHILPAAAGVALTQASLLVPHYILSEVTLSFLGLGVGEPVPSWGGMLADARQVHVLVSHPWLLAPAPLLVAVLVLYLFLADRALE